MKHPYVCPRCGYTVHHKQCMVRHLFKKSKPCPSIESDIELTENIMLYILNNRTYKIPKQNEKNPTHVTNNTVNVINLVSDMELGEKVCKYTSYTNVVPMNFEDKVEDTLGEKAGYLECNSNLEEFNCLMLNDILEIIDDISNGKSLLDTNILYDSKLNKLHIYDADEWEAMLLVTGVTKIIKCIQSYYFNSYECYLIKCLNKGDDKAYKKSKSHELLANYYQFIGAFDIDPYVRGRYDNEILYTPSENEYLQNKNLFELEEKYFPLFKRVRDTMSQGTSNNIRKQVIDVIKRNTKKNAQEINKKVGELFKMDENFQKMLQVK